MPEVLIIGGDGFIGGAIASHFQESATGVTVTTRKRNGEAGGCIFLDLADEPNDWPPLPPADLWVLSAAVTLLSDCRENPEISHKINVEAPVALARLGIDAGAQVVFLSTNQIFDGTVAHRGPDDPPSPLNIYGHQKAEAERRMMELGIGVTVVRMTKVLSPGSGLIHGWIDDLHHGRSIAPFKDVVFSPVPISILGGFMKKMIERRTPGIIQISGPRDISYVDAVNHIVARLGFDASLVEATSAREAGVPAEHCPSNTTLNTSRLNDEFEISIPDALDVLDDVYGL